MSFDRLKKIKDNWKIFYKKLKSSNQILLLQMLFLLITINFLISGFNCRFDISSSQRFSLTNSTIQYIESLDEIIYINAYYSSEIPAEYKARILMAQEMLKYIQSINSSKIRIQFFDPDDSNEIQEQAYREGIDPQRLEKIEVGSAQVKNAFLGLTLKLDKQKEVIPVAFYVEQMEVQIVSTIKKMIRKKKNQGSNLAVLVDPGSSLPKEPSIKSGKDTFGIFIHQIFEEEFGSVPVISANNESIPADIKILLIIGLPDWNEIARYRIDQFLMRGGKLILFPKSMDFKMNPEQNYNGLAVGLEGLAQTEQGISDLNSFLGKYGVNIHSDLVYNPSMGMPMGAVVESDQMDAVKSFYPLWLVLSSKYENFSKTNPLTKDIEYLLLPWAHSLSFDSSAQDNANYEIIMQTNAKSSLLKDYVFIGEKQITSLKPDLSSEKLTLGLDIKGKFKSAFAEAPKGISLDETNHQTATDFDKESELIIIGSPYLLSDLLVLPEFRDLYQSANIPFMVNAYEILNGNQELVEARYKQSIFEPLQPFSEYEKIIYNIIHIIFIPLCIIIFAFFRMKSRNSNIMLE